MKIKFQNHICMEIGHNPSILMVLVNLRHMYRLTLLVLEPHASTSEVRTTDRGIKRVALPSARSAHVDPDVAQAAAELMRC